MDKLQLQTKNLIDENINKIGALFPSCITEKEDENGKLVKAIDFDVLKDCLSKTPIAGDDDSRYTMLWPGKRAARQLAYKSTTNTLRPCPEESVDFENTENLYIEGDNLEVLKLLRETYLGKVKMIYIDPPYNTGNDFIYNDDFRQSADEYIESTNQVDEDGNRLVKNTESSGRFHSDWLNMIYPRLLVARDLLATDGMIFISLDDGEIANLKNICNEIFGIDNFVAEFVWKSKSGGANDSNLVVTNHQYILTYAKLLSSASTNLIAYTEELEKLYTGKDEYFDERGPYRPMLLQQKGLSFSKSLTYEIEAPDGSKLVPEEGGAIWRWSKEKFLDGLKNGFVEFRKVGNEYKVYTKQYLYVDYDGKKIKRGKLIRTVIDEIDGRSGTYELQSLFKQKLFENPKPLELINLLLQIETEENSIILDFFSGSATTAHAVMQMNAEDNGHRKYIMVQLPEPCSKDSEAFKAGYKNICEIGKERIRRAGKKILEEHPDAKIDTGFRVLKVDSSNTKDIYYKPNETQQRDIEGYIDNLKEDRSSFDLLFQVMLELGIPLDVSIKTTTVNGLMVYNVAGNSLIACFDKGVNEDLIKEMAKQMPLYAAFRDVAYLDDSTKINVEQIFKQLSRDTKIFAI